MYLMCISMYFNVFCLVHTIPSKYIPNTYTVHVFRAETEYMQNTITIHCSTCIVVSPRLQVQMQSQYIEIHQDTEQNTCISYEHCNTLQYMLNTIQIHQNTCIVGGCVKYKADACAIHAQYKVSRVFRLLLSVPSCKGPAYAPPPRHSSQVHAPEVS